MPLTISFAADLVVFVAKNDPTREAGKTSWVELVALVCLEILSFDATVAGQTQGSVELVIVVFTVGRVVEDVEFRTWKRILTCPAHETLLVVAACKPSRGVFDGLSDDRF
jgi:hypothetical protein